MRRLMFELLSCPIEVPANHMSAIVRTESTGNPFAIGVVGEHRLSSQPNNAEKATELLKYLEKNQYNYSAGIAQINKSNFKAYNLNQSTVWDVCTNLLVGSQILKSCYQQYGDWGKAYSCYYSGNPTTGFKHGYVQKVNEAITKPLLTSTYLPKTDKPIHLVLNRTPKPLSLFERRLQPKTNRSQSND